MNIFRKEPLALITLGVTLVLHFVPGYTEIVGLLQPKPIEKVTLDCTEPDPDEIILYPREDHAGEIFNHITMPITCLLYNNTSEPISVVEYGPALISNRRSSAFLFERNVYGSITPIIGEKMSVEVTEGNAKVPLFLQPKEVWEFNSLFAVPYVDIVAQGDEERCIKPSPDNIENWSGMICLFERKIGFTNFLHKPLSVGFWDWNEYGQVVKLGDNRTVFFADRYFIKVATCKDEDPETSLIPTCRNGSWVRRPTTWTTSN